MAIRLITFDDNSKFKLNYEAEEFLKTLTNQSFGVVGVIGKYRTGKSFFIN